MVAAITITPIRSAAAGTGSFRSTSTCPAARPPRKRCSMACCCCRRRSGAPAPSNAEKNTMTDPADMIVPLLREMRAENLEQHEQTRAMVMAPDKRLGGVEDAQRSFRQALTADPLLSKL